ncbi:MAG: hypothetical protein P4N59_33400 [Negativicutes bacterium]|nr:hypothetical protein [Negativicutes bacterium]
MNYYLVLGAINSVIDYNAIYADEALAAQSASRFIGADSGALSDRSIISSDRNGVNYRALYLILEVDESKLENSIYILVRSVPYLHSTTSARVFYDKNEAKAEVDSFNAALSRANFHAYLFTFSV